MPTTTPHHAADLAARTTTDTSVVPQPESSQSCGSESLIEQVSHSSLVFSHLSHSVKTKNGEKKLIDDVSVKVQAGELLAIMGPSGAGKSTLLDLMSARKAYSEGGSVTLNGGEITPTLMQKISSFVEQEDSLLGVLSVRETITYALRLFLPALPRKQVNKRVERCIDLLGLQSCCDTRIGTPIQRGISGGQKRRVSLACSIVTFPRILFLDEPTSGLDSTAAREVMIAVRNVAQAEGIVVLATIHQPSFETMEQFTNLLLLSGGRICYNGRATGLESFLSRFGVPVPRHVNPTDCAMNILNTDFHPFDSDVVPGLSSADALHNFYLSELKGIDNEMATLSGPTVEEVTHQYNKQEGKAKTLRALLANTLVLSQRLTINYSRNLLAYGVRVAMYAGMGLLLATIWIRLGTQADTINDRLSVHFFSVAFLAFMSVAGIPGFLEERAVFRKERANGLYGTLPFVLSNSLVNIPFLFFCSIVFILIMYWGVGLHGGAPAFFRYLGFLYLALYCAESQVVLIAAIIPIFIAALAIGAFMNGFWMSVGGYFLKYRSMPHFWRVSFHWMDYQTYAFALLTNVGIPAGRLYAISAADSFLLTVLSPLKSDLKGLVFQCTGGQCPYPSTIGNSQISGEDVLRFLEMDYISYGKYAGIVIAITVIYRIALFLALKYLRKL